MNGDQLEKLWEMLVSATEEEFWTCLLNYLSEEVDDNE